MEAQKLKTSSMGEVIVKTTTTDHSVVSDVSGPTEKVREWMREFYASYPNTSYPNSGYGSTIQMVKQWLSDCIPYMRVKATRSRSCD